LLDLPTLTLMKRAGCWQIAYGIESGSQKVLDIVKHEVRLPRLRETLRLTREAGIRAKGYLMLGHPTEDRESLEETLAFMGEVDLDIAQVTKFTPYPGTPAYPTIDQYGTFTEDWERIHAVNLRAPFLICRAVLPGMRRRGWGRIVNRASIFGSVSKE
jgi:radical SAM superfamily enzyme YgiQ (UPF0313 family)